MRNKLSNTNFFQANTFHTFRGSGKIQFQDGFALDVSFSVYLLNNSRFIGDLLYKGIFSKEKMYDYFNKKEPFALVGTDPFDTQLKIIGYSCVIERIEEGSIAGFLAMRSKFYLTNLQVFYEKENKKPSREILLEFGLTNVIHLVDISIDTVLGRMSLVKEASINNTDLLMKLANLSSISSISQHDE